MLGTPEDIIARLRLRQTETQTTLRRIAQEAGLHANSLTRLDDPSWRPRLDTLGKLQRWLDGEATAVESIAELPLAGPGWHLTHDREGWWVIADNDHAAWGPYSTVRAAVKDASEATFT